MIVPVPAGLAEDLDAIRAPMESDAAVQRDYKVWEKSRSQFMVDLEQRGTEANKRGWQKHYFKGETQSGESVPDHQTRVNIREFRRADRLDPK